MLHYWFNYWNVPTFGEVLVAFKDMVWYQRNMLYLITNENLNKIMANIVATTGPTDGMALSSARASVGSVITTVKSLI